MCPIDPLTAIGLSFLIVELTVTIILHVEYGFVGFSSKLLTLFLTHGHSDEQKGNFLLPVDRSFPTNFVINSIGQEIFELLNKTNYKPNNNNRKINHNN